MKKFYINKLPPQLSDSEEKILLRKQADIYNLLRKLDVKMNFDLVNANVINSFRIHEAMESTRIEGTQTTMQEMFEAKATNKDNRDIREVLNYLNALDLGKNMVETDGFIATRTIKALHKKLLEGDVRGAHCDPGVFRRIDDIWIGKEGSTRETASYVPLSNIHIHEYMENLEKYMNTSSDTLPVMATAIIHAQFESIHPFLDGNGRVGRMLIPLMFKLKGDNTLSNLFVSKQLEESKYKYYDLLNGTRKETPEWFNWILFFMESVEESIQEAIVKYDQILALYRKYENKDSLSYTKVLNAIFNNPIVTISSLVAETKLSRPTINKVLAQMSDARIIYKSDDIRNTRYICYDLLKVL